MRGGCGSAIRRSWAVHGRIGLRRAISEWHAKPLSDAYAGRTTPPDAVRRSLQESESSGPAGIRTQGFLLAKQAIYR